MIHKAHFNKIYDTAIIGGGVLGLWAARHAIKRGESVVLIEKRHIGAGASGGFLGALMPHMPDGWDAKKQFQYGGLSTLSEAIAELQSDTGHDCGYRMCGRIMPLAHEKMLQHMPVRIKGSSEFWADGYEMSLLNTTDFASDWINPDVAKFGIQYDTFSARVNPRAYLSALEAYVRPRCEVLEGLECVGILPKLGQIALLDGEKISAGKIIVANGYEAYPLLQPFMGAMNKDKPIGCGVKGQAVLVEYAHNDDLPIVYHDGSYVVPHANNRVAIGSTSVGEWQDATAFDEDNMGFYERATELVPALKDAPIIDKWASVRPRNTLEGKGTDPYFGAVENYENLVALIGGFKITLGVGHLIK